MGHCLDLSARSLSFTDEYFHGPVIFVFMHFICWGAGWLLSETVLVPFKYLKHHQAGDSLDFLKLYFATWETEKSLRELKAVELKAAKARSIVLVLKDRFLCLLWQFKLESSVPSLQIFPSLLPLPLLSSPPPVLLILLILSPFPF